MDTLQELLAAAEKSFSKIYDHTQKEIQKLRADRATPSMVDTISINHYNTPTPLRQLASITTPDAGTIIIKPYDKKTLPEIERAIAKKNIHSLVPLNDGEKLRIPIPPLTEERRKAIVKEANKKAEEGKVHMRNERKNIKNSLQKLSKERISEDLIKKSEVKLQKLTNLHIVHIDDFLKAKEKALMKI